MDIIFSASILAAFLAGMVALFAPCCITVLLPAYLGSAFREKKNILKMTFVFFAGISIILIPIGLGAAWLASVFSNFHKEMYIVGAIVMLIFAVAAFRGKGFSFIPMPRRTAHAGSSHAKSVFILGLFSGAATSCCAPVLAGAVTLAVISGVFWKALIVVFAYVFGMTFPLFLAAYFYDRFKIENSRFIIGKILEFRVAGKTITVHSTNLIAGLLFLVMSVILFAIVFSDNTFWAPSYQVAIGETLQKASGRVFDGFSVIPDFIWSIIIIGIFLFLLFKAEKKFHS